MAGRRPRTPTAVLEARGSKRAAERRATEIALPPGAPPCPDEVAGEGRRLWDDILARYLPIGAVSETDWPSLTALCMTYQEWWVCADVVRKDGAFYDLEQGGQKIRAEKPEARRARQLLAELRHHFVQWGLSPAARAGISLPAGRPKPTASTPSKPGASVKDRVFGGA